MFKLHAAERSPRALFFVQAPCTVQWGECDVPPSFPRHAKVQAGRVPLRPRGDVSTLYQRQQGKTDKTDKDQKVDPPNFSSDKLFARKFLSPLNSDLCFFPSSIFRSQRTCRIRSLLLFCKMSPCSHWHSCLSPRKSRSVENTSSGASGYLRARFTRAGQDLCSKNTFCRLTKRVPHIPALLLSPFSTFALQRNFSMSVNSAAVMRLMGKGVGGAAPTGVARGRGATRGGRGKTPRLTLVLKLTQQKRWPEHLADNTMDVMAEGCRGHPGQPLECLFPPVSQHLDSAHFLLACSSNPPFVWPHLL